MALSAAQRTLFNKATRLGSGRQAVGLTDEACKALLALTARDLGVMGELASSAGDDLSIYSSSRPSLLQVKFAGTPAAAFEQLLADGPQDTDTYFSCLAALHKARLKYERILATQPVPTIDQVGPRGLLLYGLMDPPSLAALLLCRKWIFDVDNRAGQETGYLFEPVLAGAIGGAPAAGQKSPVRRRNNHAKARQVDCVLDQFAYEFKLRVTIAASGQGRWGEELAFPLDCVDSGLIPVLIVLDPTDDPKLTQLSEAFIGAGGQVFTGDAAWAHLEEKAGPTMSLFLETYVRGPLADLLSSVPASDELPKFTLELSPQSVVFKVGDGEAEFPRDEPDLDLIGEGDEPPEDASDDLPGL